VKLLLSPLLFLSLLLLSTGCGNVFVRGAIETGSSIQGSVRIVQLGNTLTGMETVQVTFVTLLQNGAFSILSFCGDQSAFFPLDQTVRVNFNPGQPCATVIAVVIVV